MSMRIPLWLRRAALLTALCALSLTTAQAEQLSRGFGYRVHVVSVSPSSEISGERAARVRIDDCYDIRVPPHPVEDGAYLEVGVVGDRIEARIGFYPSSIIHPCFPPLPPRFFSVSLGQVPPGNYELHLIGVDPEDGLAEYPFDTLAVTIAPPSRTIPSSDASALILLAVLIALLAAPTMRRLEAV